MVTCVWVGVLVASLTNLRFGWTYSGLAAPGYVVPLLLVRPWTAAVILVEAALTYLIVYFISEKMPRGRAWSSFFGRDRFFAILVTSVAVRVVLDGWLLPIVGLYMVDHLGLAFDYRNELQSFGLIIVALVANLFWKPGLIRGIGPFAFNLTITLFIVRFGLMEFTNFDLASIQFMYEDIATSLLASPKAYIVLLTTAAIASHLNLRYAWEYSGILLPALLALQWYEPVKVLATVIEVAVVFWVGGWALKLPWIRNLTMEGSRKLLLFFTIAFLYRLTIGFVIPRTVPSFRVSDFYGFGYLLSTLLAVKAHQKGILPRLLRATLQVSVIGAIAANLLGLALLSLPGHGASESPSGPVAASLAAHRVRSIDQLLLRHRLSLDRIVEKGRVEMPTPTEHSLLDEAFDKLRIAIDSRDPEGLTATAARFAQLGLDVSQIDERYIVVEERSPRGWGLYLFDRSHPDGVVVEVPSPVEEPNALLGAIEIFSGLGAASLAIGGTPTEGENAVDPLLRPESAFQSFHRRFGLGRTVQLRAIRMTPTEDPSPDPETSSTVLWVDRSLPKGLDLEALEKLISNIEVQWQPWQDRNFQRRSGRGGFAELLLTGLSAERLRVRRVDRILEDFTADAHPLEQRISDFGLWVEERQNQVIAAGSNQYHAPSLHEMLFLDREVLRPLLAASQVEQGHDGVAGIQRHLAIAEASIAADELGLRVASLGIEGEERALLLWHDGSQRHPRGWGGVAISTNPSSDFVFEAPHPRSNGNTLRVAAELFDQLGGEALIFSGAHPEANHGGSADVLDRLNKVSLFTAAHQALLREASDRSSTVVQVRSLSEPGPVFLASKRGPLTSSPNDASLNFLAERLTTSGTPVERVTGQRRSAGLEVGTSFHAEYLQQTTGEKLFAFLWLPRSTVDAPLSAGHLEELLSALDIPTSRQSITESLKQYRGQPNQPPFDLLNGIEEAASTTDLIALASTLNRYQRFVFSVAASTEGLGTFLVVKPDLGAPWLLRLGVGESTTDVKAVVLQDSDAVSLALANSVGWLWLKDDNSIIDGNEP